MQFNNKSPTVAPSIPIVLVVMESPTVVIKELIVGIIGILGRNNIIDILGRINMIGRMRSGCILLK